MTRISPDFNPSRAIYVDFESLRKDPPSPALLGALVDGDRHGFEQLILDPILADAARAKRHCRAISLPDAVARIVKRAETEGRTIVGWSLFERSVVQRSDIPQAVKDRFVAHYINGREVASRWKSVLHPDVKLPKDNKFDPRNRLDRYAELTRYGHLAVLQGKPAAWLRRVSQAMTTSKGRYQLLRETQKEVWLNLLRYNEHDCRALAHVVQKAAFELEKWREYARTRFCVFDEPRPQFCFTIGSKSAKLDRLLADHGADRWAFITAWNPASVELSREENDRRQAELRSQLSAYIVIPGEGVGRDPAWPPEPSLMVLGIPRKDAIRLGRKAGQLAIVAGHKGFPARLLACSPLPKLSWTRKTRVTEE